MVDSIRRFFEKHIKSPSENTGEVSEHALQIATSALLIEMMRADAEISEDERHTITNTIKSKFTLSEKETEELMELAEEKIWEATGYFEFTSLLNRGLSYGQKVKVIEHLWEIAYADEILDKHEEYMVRRIADLIYVSHKDFIEAKLRVRRNIVK